jgi:hypothetical protein
MQLEDGELKAFRTKIVESVAATSLSDMSSPSSISNAASTLLDLEQSNHDCDQESDSKSSV